MKKFFILILVIALMGTLLIGCSSKEEASGETSEEAGTEYKEKLVSIATGSVSGTYFPLGGAFSSIINKNMDGVNCSVESTGGSVANILLISENETELAFVAASSAFDALNKQGAFTDKNVDNISGILSLYPEAVQIISTNADIKSVSDLKGKKVAVGAVGSGTETMAKTILGLYGMTYDDITEDFLGFTDASTGLKDNTIDAAFIWAGVPTSGVMDLGSQHDISLINFEEQEVAKLKKISPYAISINIDKSVYSSLVSESTTIAIPAILIGDTELSEEFVYNLLVNTFENQTVLQNAHNRGFDITLETALDGLDGISLHPGAQKFYEEKGLL